MRARAPGAGARQADRLRSEAVRLAAELDQARFHKAAAHASTAADAIDEGFRGARTDARTDVEADFELDEHGRVWMILEGDCHIIGRENAVCEQMRRFLAMVVLTSGRR